MTEMYEQEHNSMMSIIDDARHSLALAVDELHDEQQVLSQTADKISTFLSQFFVASAWWPNGWRGGRVVSAFDSYSEGHWFESRWGRSLRNNCGQVVHTHRAQQGRGPA